ncbi:MAG TPA: WD40 repeat domain-containing protein, partial [Polyangiaceae bacterium]|nr:WD40 repeat domain-containing protein [Polyangiaceae bacterium]
AMPRYVLGYGWLKGASWVSNDALCVITWAGVFRCDAATGAMTPLVEGVRPDHPAASADGARLAYNDGDDVVMITTGGETLWRAPHGQARDLAFSPDGRSLLVAHYDQRDGRGRRVQVLDAATGKERALCQYTGRFAAQRMVHDPKLVAASPDGGWVAACGSDGVYLWQSDGTPVTTWYAQRVEAMAFVEGGERLLVADGDAHAGDDRLYLATREGERVRSYPASKPVWQWLALALDPGGARFAAAARGDGVHVFGLEGERQLFLTEDGPLRLEPGDGRKLHVTSLAFSPDGARLAVCTSTPYNADRGERPMSLQIFDVATGERRAIVRDFAYEPRDVVPRGDRLFLAVDGEAREASIAFGRPRTLVPRAHNSGARAIAVGPGEARLAAGFDGSGGGLAAYEPATGQKLRDFAGATKEFGARSLAFSPDGELLAAAGGSALVWRFDRATPLAKLAPKKGKLDYEDEMTSLAFRRDGKLLGVAARDGKVRLYGAPKFALVRELEALERPLRLESFAFSPDGRLAFAGDIKGGVHAWDVDTGDPLYYLEAGAGCVERLALTDDGRWLAGGTREGRLFLADAAGGALRKA